MSRARRSGAQAESAGLTASNLADKVREVGTKAKEAVKEEVQGSTGSQGQGSGAGLTTGGATTLSATTGSTTAWITKDVVGPFKGEPGSAGW